MAKTSQTQDRFPGAQPAGDGAVPHCQWRGCSEIGVHRAPQDQSLADYYVFCLEHVRLYNAQWNYHEGLGADEIEIEYRSAATWDRPTWKMGDRHAPGRPWHNVYDPFDVYRDSPGAGGHVPHQGILISTEEAKARRILGLSGPLSLDSLKARYKALVKRHHPDANGGSASAEDRMKKINAAYQVLRSALILQSE